MDRTLKQKHIQKVKRAFIFAYFLACFFLFNKQNLFAEEVKFDIFCFENARYAVVGEVAEMEEICKDYRHLERDHQIVNIEIKEVIKGEPLPKNISVMFDLDSRSGIKGNIEKGKKILLFLNPSLAYYYAPIWYGSVYLLEENDIEIYKKQLKSTSVFLHRDLPESLLKEYGFFDYNDCGIIYEVSGGHSPYYMRKLTIFGDRFAKCEIREVGKKDLSIVEFRLSREFIQELISAFTRMDFFNIKYVEDKKIIDASWEILTYSCGEKKNSIEGYPDTYAKELTEYQFSNLGYKLSQVLDYAEKNKNIPSEQIPEFRDISSASYSFEYVKEKIEAGGRGPYKYSKAIIRCKEKDKLIPYLISKLDFKDDTHWVQGETRVNLVRILRYITKCELGYSDKFIHNSNDEEIQKVKSVWKNWWHKNKEKLKR